ncbi:hypothetical protein C8Q80DRAFT_1181715 [Daedaleopsis nitida]|nr:hypothetical protein C8Q80DRAFT_1181715 [Daedaleopsis nitida]
MYSRTTVSIKSAVRRQSCGSAGRPTSLFRMMSSGGSLVRPAPPPLPRDQQREFEELVRAAQAPLSAPQKGNVTAQEADIAMHPDARAPLPAEFEGEVNPVTGEQGGPKREPVGRWGEGDGDWSFKGRVSDF